jgi:hypothetical protein
MSKIPSTKVLKTCRIEKQYIEYCTMQGLNFNGLVNTLLKEFVVTHQRDELFRERWSERGLCVYSKLSRP